jgi:hypothetical protein
MRATLIALSAPHETWIAGESSDRLSLPHATYRAAGVEKHLMIDAGPSEGADVRAVEWLLRK